MSNGAQRTYTGRQAIALTAILGTLTAGAFVCYLLVVGPDPATRRLLEMTMPRLFGLEPVAVAALGATLTVTAGVLVAVVCEAVRQVAVARTLRIELETTAFEDLD